LGARPRWRPIRCQTANPMRSKSPSPNVRSALCTRLRNLLRQKRLPSPTSTQQNDGPLAFFSYEERRISRCGRTMQWKNLNRLLSSVTFGHLSLILNHSRLRFPGGDSVMRRWASRITLPSSLFAPRRLNSTPGGRSLTKAARKIAFRAAPRLPRFYSPGPLEPRRPLPQIWRVNRRGPTATGPNSPR